MRTILCIVVLSFTFCEAQRQRSSLQERRRFRTSYMGQRPAAWRAQAPRSYGLQISPGPHTRRTQFLRRNRLFRLSLYDQRDQPTEPILVSDPYSWPEVETTTLRVSKDPWKVTTSPIGTRGDARAWRNHLQRLQNQKPSVPSVPTDTLLEQGPLDQTEPKLSSNSQAGATPVIAPVPASRLLSSSRRQVPTLHPSTSHSLQAKLERSKSNPRLVKAGQLSPEFIAQLLPEEISQLPADVVPHLPKTVMDPNSDPEDLLPSVDHLVIGLPPNIAKDLQQQIIDELRLKIPEGAGKDSWSLAEIKQLLPRGLVEQLPKSPQQSLGTLRRENRSNASGQSSLPP